MKIRTQFILLTTGIVIMPLLVFGILFLVEYNRAPERILVPGYREISAVSGTGISLRTWTGISRMIERKPENVDFLVLDGSGTVLFSTDAAIPQSSILTDADIFSMIRENHDKYLYQLDTTASEGDPATLVLSRILRVSHWPFNPLTKILATILITLASLLAFSASMSVLIARSITRSVTVLEDSTRRIAAGELDLAVDAGGSNEITSLVVSLNSMRLALKDEQMRRSRFIMGVSHDLKTPLALIKGYSEAIADGMADDPGMLHKSLLIIGNKVDQLEEMIDDLISFVKLDTGEWRHTLKDHAVAPLVRAFVKRIAGDAALLEHRVESSIRLDDSISVPLDERLFFRALENIANNAIQYSPPDSAILITAALEGNEIQVAITDNGPGIEEADLPHIFDLFYRGSNSRREAGLGLGLSVVKSVADSHGWKVSIRSAPGSGSTFTMRIPFGG